MPLIQHLHPSLFDQPVITADRALLCAAAAYLPSPAVMYYQQLQEPGHDALYFQDEIRYIKRILLFLPEAQAHLCNLYFIEDFTYEEIARFTNLSPTTVKNHIAWSMIILRNYMTRPKAPV